MLKRLAALVGIVVVVPACLRDTPIPVQGTSTTFKSARMSGQQEVPSNLSPATGEATAVVDPTQTSLTITLTFSGLVDITEAHIHVGEPGVDGSIIFPLASGPFASPLVVTLKEANLTPQPGNNVVTFQDALNALRGGHTYANIHTAVFRQGEIRGQIGPVQMISHLDGAQEVPPVEQTGTGTLLLALNDDQSAMTFTLDVAGLNNLTEAHLHAGPPGVSGPILIPLASAPFETPLSGTLTGVPAETVDRILAGTAYANVHTALHPDGEIRGQIMSAFVAPASPTTTPPATTPPTTTPPTGSSPPLIIIGPYGSRDR